MKLLHVIPTLNPKNGGPGEGVRQIAKEFSKRGHTVECICLDLPESPWLSDNFLKIHSASPGFMKYYYSPSLYDWLIANIESYDFVVINGLWQYTGLATSKACREKKIPYFVFTHGMLDPWFKEAYPIKHFKKLIYWLLFERRILRGASRVLFTCAEELTLSKGTFPGSFGSPYIVSYGTTSSPTNSAALKEHFLSRNPTLRGKRLFLFLGRIHEKKGCDLLINAFAQVASFDPDLQLIIAGPDESGLTEKLKVESTKLKIFDRVTWVGMVSGDDKWGAYYAAEIFCLPSHQENFGIAVAEALSCGKPVLISNKVNIWREVEASGAGVVESDTLEGTLTALKKWLMLTLEEKKQMERASVQCFNEKFSVSGLVDDLLECFNYDAIKK